MRQTAHVVSRRDFDAWLAEARPAGRGCRRRRRRRRGPGRQERCSPPTAAAAATRSPTPAPSGTIGPDLDKVLKGKDEAFIQAVDHRPETEIAPGFQGGIMPGNFGQSLSPDQLKALVDYLSQVTQ